jgi:tetratricopeptide (TPR) repeat protein
VVENAAAIPSPEREPETADEFFARGMKYLHYGQSAPALSYFLKAEQRSHNPWTCAFAAYCMALEGQVAAAATEGIQAQQEGVNGPELDNIIGYSLTESNNPKDALPYLDRAIAAAPQMSAARCNRALARFKAGLKAKAPVADIKCADDMTAALAAGPPSLDLHVRAASIYAACSKANPALRVKACEQIEAAIKAGHDPARFREEYFFKTHFTGDPLFEKACATPRGTPQAKPAKPANFRLVEPVRP